MKKKESEEKINTREEIIVNRLKEKWEYYRKLPLEDIRKDIIKYLRKENKNSNEQLSHEEFTQILLKQMKKGKEENSYKNRRIKNKRNKEEER